MVEANVSDDIRKYPTKVFGPFTQRQMVSTGLALLVLIPISILLCCFGINVGVSILIAAVPALPVMLCGFVKINNTNAEIVLLRIVYTKFLTPALRKNIKESELYKKMKEYKKAKYENSLLDRRARDRRAYKKGKIVYNKKDFTYYH